MLLRLLTAVWVAMDPGASHLSTMLVHAPALSSALVTLHFPVVAVLVTAGYVRHWQEAHTVTLAPEMFHTAAFTQLYPWIYCKTPGANEPSGCSMRRSSQYMSAVRVDPQSACSLFSLPGV